MGAAFQRRVEEVAAMLPLTSPLFAVSSRVIGLVGAVLTAVAVARMAPSSLESVREGRLTDLGLLPLTLPV